MSRSAPSGSLTSFSEEQPSKVAFRTLTWLPAGKTDGLVLKELIKRTGETEIAVRVMQAQLLLQNRSAGTLPRELLFDVPVVREDSPAFIELLKLQADYPMLEHEAEAFFKATKLHVIQCWGILVFMTVLFLVLGVLFLRRIGKDTR